MASKSSQPGSGTRITWDEETIAEHDKLRGTRSKIVEANLLHRHDQDGDTAVSVGSCGRVRRQGLLTPSRRPSGQKRRGLDHQRGRPERVKARGINPPTAGAKMHVVH